MTNKIKDLIKWSEDQWKFKELLGRELDNIPGSDKLKEIYKKELFKEIVTNEDYQDLPRKDGIKEIQSNDLVESQNLEEESVKVDETIENEKNNTEEWKIQTKSLMIPKWDNYIKIYDLMEENNRRKILFNDLKSEIFDSNNSPSWFMLVGADFSEKDIKQLDKDRERHIDKVKIKYAETWNLRQANTKCLEKSDDPLINRNQNLINVMFRNMLSFWVKVALELWSTQHNASKKVAYLHNRLYDVDKVKTMMEWSDKEIRDLTNINYVHNNVNGHVGDLFEYFRSQQDYKENLQLNYADEIGIPKDFQFNIKKNVEVDWQDVVVVSQWFFVKNNSNGNIHSNWKYIVWEKNWEKYFIYDTGMSEHRFIAEKNGIEKVLGWWWMTVKSNWIRVYGDSEFYGEDPNQESWFTKKVFEKLI